MWLWLAFASCKEVILRDPLGQGRDVPLFGCLTPATWERLQQWAIQPESDWADDDVISVADGTRIMSLGYEPAKCSEDMQDAGSHWFSWAIVEDKRLARGRVVMLPPSNLRGQ